MTNKRTITPREKNSLVQEQEVSFVGEIETHSNRIRANPHEISHLFPPVLRPNKYAIRRSMNPYK